MLFRSQAQIGGDFRVSFTAGFTPDVRVLDAQPVPAYLDVSGILMEKMIFSGLQNRSGTCRRTFLIHMIRLFPDGRILSGRNFS